MLTGPENKPIQQRLEELYETRNTKERTIQEYFNKIVELARLVSGERAVITALNDEIYNLQISLGMPARNENWNIENTLAKDAYLHAPQMQAQAQQAKGSGARSIKSEEY